MGHPAPNVQLQSAGHPPASAKRHARSCFISELGPTDFREVFLERSRKTPGLKTRATTFGQAGKDCCSPPLQRRGLMRACATNSISEVCTLRKAFSGDLTDL